MYRIVFKIIYITDTVYYVDTLMLKCQWICFFFFCSHLFNFTSFSCAHAHAQIVDTRDLGKKNKI